MKKIISAISIILCLMICFSACGEGGIGEFKTPEGSFPEMEKLNSNFNYNSMDGVFRLTLDWKIGDGYTATFDDNYYLGYSRDDDRLFLQCDPVETRVLTGETQTLKPGEKTEIVFDIERDFDIDGYPGNYQFVKIFEVTDPDGNTEKRVGVFEIYIG